MSLSPNPADRSAARAASRLERGANRDFLAVLNSVGTDGSFGSQDRSDPVLSGIGRTITPVFSPMGVQEDNWPATVGLFTGVLAKETVVGTLNSLCSQEYASAGQGAVSPGGAVTGEAALSGGAIADEAATFSFWGRLSEAAATIPANLSAVPAGFVDPLGLGVLRGTSAQVAEEVGAATSVYAGLRAGFVEGRPQAYAYLLFVLLYIPCVAAFGAMTREMGLRYTLLAAACLGLSAWSVATLFYQLTVVRHPLWIGVGVVGLLFLPATFWIRSRMKRPLRLRAGLLSVSGEFAPNEH